MPPKVTFSREEIEDAAFKLFASGGMQNVSVRKIAAALGSSTAPIYTSFGNMDEIKEIIIDKALKLLQTYTERTYTHDAFLNIGTGLLIFARENRMLYRTLFMESNEYQAVLERFYGQNLSQMKKNEELAIFSDSELSSMLEKMTIYTHGLAAHLCAGMLKDTSDEWFINTLTDMGQDVIGATAFRTGKTDYMNYEGRCDDEENHAD